LFVSETGLCYYSPGWSQTHHIPAWASRVLGIHACSPMPSFTNLILRTQCGCVWCICVILAFRSLSQENCEFKASLSHTGRPYVKKKKKNWAKEKQGFPFHPRISQGNQDLYKTIVLYTSRSMQKVLCFYFYLTLFLFAPLQVLYQVGTCCWLFFGANIFSFNHLTWRWL
jgi:hypothetical protein